jgi:hypothetical protein
MSTVSNEHEDPYPSLSDYHDYEPNLEFDDTELQHATAEPGTLDISSLPFIFPTLSVIPIGHLPL